MLFRTLSPRTRIDKAGLHAFSMLVCAGLLVHGVSAAKRRIILRPAGYNPWADGKPLQTGYTTMASASDGRIYVFGGSASRAWADALFQLDVDTGEWHLITPMETLQPSARLNHAMAAVGTDIYLFGGKPQEYGSATFIEESGPCQDLFRFSTISMEWKMMDAAAGVTGTPPSARDSHAMAAVGTDIYLFGGFTESGKGCIWSMGKGRRSRVCMLAAGYRAVGLRMGRMGARKSYGRKTWLEQPCTTRRVYGQGGGECSGRGHLSRQVVPATLHCSLAVRPDVFVGLYAGETSGELFRFSTISKEWTMLDAAAGVTSPSAMAAVGTDIFVFGDSEVGSGSSGELFRFSTITMEWTTMNMAAGVTDTSPHARVLTGGIHSLCWQGWEDVPVSQRGLVRAGRLEASQHDMLAAAGGRR